MRVTADTNPLRAKPVAQPVPRYTNREMDPAHSAHVIVDLQNGFLANGALAEVPVAREMIPNVNRISAAMRSAGGLNVFLRYTYDEAEQQPWVSWYRTYMTPEIRAAFKDAFSREAEPWG